MVSGDRRWDGSMFLDFEETVARLEKDLEALGDGNLCEKLRKAKALARLELVLKEANASPSLQRE